MTVSAATKEREQEKLMLTDAEMERLTPHGRMFLAIAQNLMNPPPAPPRKRTYEEMWAEQHPPVHIPNPIDIVYFIGAGDHHVKIGVTSNLAKRLKALSTSHYLDLVVLAAIENAPGGLEQELHDRFAQYRVRPDKEWFRLSPEIQAFIDEINRGAK